MHVFLKHDLFAAFDIPIAKFALFLDRVERGYGENPYHNHLHAADVLHNCDFIASKASENWFKHQIQPANAPPAAFAEQSTLSLPVNPTRVPAQSYAPISTPHTHSSYSHSHHHSHHHSTQQFESCCLPSPAPSSDHSPFQNSDSASSARRKQTASSLAVPSSSPSLSSASGGSRPPFVLANVGLSPSGQRNTNRSPVPEPPISSAPSVVTAAPAQTAAQLPHSSPTPTDTALPFTPFHLLTLFLSAICHDYDHPGCTAAFLIRSSDTRIRQFVEQGGGSPLERHHAHRSWKLLEQSGGDFLSHLPAAQLASLQELFLDLVLATDLALHAKLMAQVTESVKTAMALTSDDKVSTSLTATPIWPWWQQSEDTVLLLKSVIKLADVGNPAKPLPLAARWASMVQTEFWNQGDAERSLWGDEKPLSMHCDRTKPTVADCQVGFAGMFCAPLVEAVTPACGDGMEAPRNCLERNMAWWKERKAAGKQTIPHDSEVAEGWSRMRSAVTAGAVTSAQPLSVPEAQVSPPTPPPTMRAAAPPVFGGPRPPPEGEAGAVRAGRRRSDSGIDVEGFKPLVGKDGRSNIEEEIGIATEVNGLQY
ncbi:hypothetical protein HDU93_008994 [Gonapodya sp. JEL0774]|nr:hypothetical protein HDU93_008994 [Gonapodya sp. JEL0774]